MIEVCIFYAAILQQMLQRANFVNAKSLLGKVQAICSLSVMLDFFSILIIRIFFLGVVEDGALRR